VILLRAGADPDASNDDGLAPLHVAAARGHRAIAEALQAGGASINLRDSSGRCATDYALVGGHVVLAESLRGRPRFCSGALTAATCACDSSGRARHPIGRRAAQLIPPLIMVGVLLVVVWLLSQHWQPQPAERAHDVPMAMCAQLMTSPDDERMLAVHCRGICYGDSACAAYRVRLCINATHGLVRLWAENDARADMLLRVGGPHPQTALFRRSSTSRGDLVAAFRLCLGGTYTVHVRLIATARPSNQSWRTTARPVGRTRAATAEPILCAVYDRPAASIIGQYAFEVSATGYDARCTTCLWTWRGQLDPTATEARDSLASLSSSPHPWRFEMPVHFNASFLSFDDPGAARADAWATHQLTVPPDESHFPVCLVGDSHMRNLANSLIALLSADCDAAQAQETKGVCKTQWVAREWPELVRYRRLTGELDIQKSDINGDAMELRSFLHGCRGLVLGHGTWALSHERAHLPAPSADHYAVQVQRSLRHWATQLARDQRVPIAWLGLHPMPLYHPQSPINWSEPHHPRSGMLRCPIADRRLPHIIASFNDAARLESQRAGATFFLDTWPVVFPLFDLSFDGQHYQHPTGRQLARGLLHWFRTSLAQQRGTARQPTGYAAPSIAAVTATELSSQERYEVAGCADGKGLQWCVDHIKSILGDVRKARQQRCGQSAFLQIRCAETCRVCEQ